MMDEEQTDAAEAWLAERARQVAALAPAERELLLDAAGLTLAARRHAADPGEGVRSVADDFLAQGDEDDWLDLWETESEGPPETPLELSDPEHLAAQLDGHDLAIVILFCVCARALADGCAPTDVIDGWAAEHSSWEPGTVERLEGLTRSVWQAKQMLGVEARVAEHGYTYTYVMAEPSFCYTTGLWQTYNHPELFLYGLSQQDAVGILGGLIAEIRDHGRRFAAGEVDRQLFNLPVGFVEIPKDELPGRLNIAAAFYGDLQFQAFQVVLSDAAGLMPWQEGCDSSFVEMQPLLGVAPSPAG